MHIYLIGVLISALIMAITFLTKLRKVGKTKELFFIKWGDILFAAICLTASWATVLVFVLMCIAPNIENKIVRKF